MAASGRKGGRGNEDLVKGDKIARPDSEGLEFTQLLWEVVGSLVWAEAGLWKVEKLSLGLGRRTSCWIVGRTDDQLSGEESLQRGNESQSRESDTLQLGL